MAPAPPAIVIRPGKAVASSGASYDFAVGGTRSELFVTVDDLLGQSYRVGMRFAF